MGAAVSLMMILLSGSCHKVVGYVRREEQRYIRGYLTGGLHSGILYGLFFSCYITVMGPQIAGLVCVADDSLAGQMLERGAFIVLCAALGNYFSRIMLMLNGKFQVIGAAAFKNIIFVISLLFFLGGGQAGILSLVYAGLLGEAVFAAAEGVLLFRQLRVPIDWIRHIGLPAGCSLAVGLLMWVVRRSIAPHLGSIISMLLCFMLGTVCYVLLLLFLKDFREQDLNYIPGGNLVRRLGQLLRLY